MKTKFVIYIIVFIFLISIAIAEDSSCGNGICNSFDTYYSCPIDCPSGSYDNYCDNEKDDVCDPDCINSDSDCQNYDEKNQNTYLPEKENNNTVFKTIFIIIFSVVVFGGIFYLYKKANKNKDYYDEGQIDELSNLNKEKENNTWSTKSETQIIDQIKESDDFKRYTGGQN